MIPKEINNHKGLNQRYIIKKSNGQAIDPKAEYFVLRLDKNGKDSVHMNACREAVITYAKNIQGHLPELAEDLVKRYGTEQLVLNGVNQQNELLKKIDSIKNFKWGMDPIDNEKRMCELITLLFL